MDDIVGFYYHPAPAVNYFLVITSEIEFDTTGDANQMDMMCTDIKGKDAPVTNEDGSSTNAPIEAVAAQAERNYDWAMLPLKVVHYPGKNDMETSGRWQNIVLKQQDAAEDERPSSTDLLALLRDDNKHLFTPAKMRYQSPENLGNGIGATTGIKVPFIYAGDTVYVRRPVYVSYEGKKRLPDSEVPV
jgi:hypothetical protein